MEQDLELIEGYLQKTLSLEDRRLVEERMKNDPVFAKRVQIVKDTGMALSYDIEEFKKDIQKIDSQFRVHNTTSVFRINRTPYLIAAAVTLFSMTFAGYLIWFQNPSFDKLYAANFQVPPENITVRAGETDEMLSAALDAYQQADFSNALEYFERVSQIHSDHPGVIFYSAICRLSLDRDQEALKNFQSIISSGQGGYLTAAQWYLGLTYIKLGDSEMAVNILTELSLSGKGTYARDAAILLEELAP